MTTVLQTAIRAVKATVRISYTFLLVLLSLLLLHFVIENKKRHYEKILLEMYSRHKTVIDQLAPITPMSINKRIFISIIQWMANGGFFACALISIIDIAMQTSDPKAWLFTQNDFPHVGYPVVRSSITIYPYLVLIVTSTALSFLAAGIEIRVYGIRYAGLDLNWTLPIPPDIDAALHVMDKSMIAARSSVSLYGKCYQFYFYSFPLILLWCLILTIITWASGENIIMATPVYAQFGIIIFLFICLALAFNTYEILDNWHIFSPENEAQFAKHVFRKRRETIMNFKAALEYESVSRDTADESDTAVDLEPEE